MNTIQKDNMYTANTYARFPIEIVSGKGALCYDADGKEYIDLGSGIAVNIFGYCDDEWIDAVTKQLKTVQHTSNLYYTSPCANLAELICKRCDMKKVFFSNSGAEANECAIKAARLWAEREKGKEYNTIVTLANSFHGRTITTLAATGQKVFHEHFTPLTAGFAYAEANNAESLENALKSNKCAAIMFETVQGEGGVVALDKEYVKQKEQLAEKYNVLMIADEVQTGNGRTGKLYGYMHYGIKPDIFTTAKGLGGGMPIGATVFGEKTADVYTPGTHGSTFGGNPVCCSGAINILNRIDDKLLDDVTKKSEYIFSELKGAKGVKSVTGLGLMIGIETEKDASDVISDCMKNGILVLKAKNKVRLLPPLNIDIKTMGKAISILKKSMAD